MLHIGVTLKEAVNLTEGGEVFFRKEAFFRESRVKSGSGVSLGKDEAVAVSLFGVSGIHVHFCEIEVCENIRDGKRTARMSGSGAVDRFDRAETDVTRLFGQHGKLCLFHEKILLKIYDLVAGIAGIAFLSRKTIFRYLLYRIKVSLSRDLDFM
jgi:hypothetical protein